MGLDQAKAFGAQSGTRTSAARTMCPEPPKTYFGEKSQDFSVFPCAPRHFLARSAS